MTYSHEATSHLFENTDFDVMEIKMITGHKSMQMLTRYALPRADRLAGMQRGGRDFQHWKVKAVACEGHMCRWITVCCFD